MINDDDFGLNIELGAFAKKIKKEVIGVIDFFLTFLTKYNEKRMHNRLALLLDFKFESLQLIYSFIGCEHRVAIANEYDRKSWIIMLLKIYHYLHPLLHAKCSFVHKIDGDNHF
jgi:hypothetical protein